MNKTSMVWSSVIVVGVCLGIIASMPPVFAAEREPGWSTGFNGGVGWFLDGYLSTGFSGRAFIEYAPYIHEIGLKLTGGYLRFIGNDSIGSGIYASEPEVTYDSWYITGGMIYRFSRRNIVPFVSGNLGMYRYHKEKAEVGVSTEPVINVDEAYTIGLNGGGGVEFFVGKSTSISVESLVHFIVGEEIEPVVDVTAMFRFFPGK